jgi:hypothetical protein
MEYPIFRQTTVASPLKLGEKPGKLHQFLSEALLKHIQQKYL